MTRSTRDRRGAPRFEIVGDLWGGVEVTARLLLRDVSRAGALIESPVPLPPDSVHTLMALADGHRHGLPVLVRHLRPAAEQGRYLLGVEFLDLPAEVAAIVARYLEYDDTVEA